MSFWDGMNPIKSFSLIFMIHNSWVFRELRIAFFIGAATWNVDVSQGPPYEKGQKNKDKQMKFSSQIHAFLSSSVYHLSRA